MNPATDPCVVSSREKLKYLDQFNALNPVNGQVTIRILLPQGYPSSVYPIGGETLPCPSRNLPCNIKSSEANPANRLPLDTPPLIVMKTKLPSTDSPLGDRGPSPRLLPAVAVAAASPGPDLVSHFWVPVSC